MFAPPDPPLASVPASSFVPPLPRSRRVAGRGALLDGVGSAASLACAVHCLATPLVVALLPTLALARLLDERVETGFLLVSALVGVASLGPTAWRARRARAWWVAPGLFVAGFAVLLGTRALEGRLGRAAGAASVMAGAGGIVAAHLHNHRRRSRGIACAAPCCRHDA